MKENKNDNSVNNNIDNNIEKKQKRDNTFSIIIGVSTFLIAILGITFAYFSATASSNENDVNVKSAFISISYKGGTKIKASNLIPSSERVAIQMFQKTMEQFGVDGDGQAYLEEDEYVNDKTRRCVDANGHEVCAMYEFTIKSDGEEDGLTSLIGGIRINKNDFPKRNNNEENEFTNLSYIIYEVEFEKDAEGKEIVDKFGNKIVSSYSKISTSNFNLVDDNEDHVGTDPNYAAFEKPFEVTDDDSNNNVVSEVYPVACLFGFSDEYATADKDSLDRCKTISVSNQTEHTYQIMIWLRETGNLQPEQGLEFQGTVNIELAGSNNGDDIITGTTIPTTTTT